MTKEAYSIATKHNGRYNIIATVSYGHVTDRPEKEPTMPTLETIYIDTTPNSQDFRDNFLHQHDARIYADEIGRRGLNQVIQDEMNQFVQGDWATAEETEENTHELTAAQFAEIMIEHVVDTVEITSRDPHTHLNYETVDGDEEAAVIIDPAIDEWEDAADAALKAEGLTRVTPWIENEHGEVTCKVTVHSSRRDIIQLAGIR